MPSDLSGEPTTRTLPLPSSSRSATDDLQLLGRELEDRARAPRAAATLTALPTRWVPRLANVPMSCGPVSVSAVWTTISSYGTPSVSAAIWATTVLSPWPRSVAASDDVERAAGRRVDERLRRVAAEVHAGRVVDGGHAGAAQLRHRQRPPSAGVARRGRHRPQLRGQLVARPARPPPASSRSASRRRRSCGAASMSPLRCAFRNRTVHGSRPTSSAILSIWTSCANVTHRHPEPAHRGRRRAVGVDAVRVDPDVRDAVRAGRVGGELRDRVRRLAAVRAAVHERRDLAGDDRPVGHDRRP